MAKANEITPCLMLSGLAVARDNGGHKRLVRGPYIARQITRPKGDSNEEVASIPECFTDPGAQRRSREFVQLFIATTIAPSQLDEARIGVIRKICSRREFSTQLWELIGFAERTALGGEASDNTFCGTKYFIKIGQFGCDGANNPAADLGKDFQHAFDGQTADRIAHRRTANRERPSDRFGRDLVTWIEATTQ